MSDQCKHCRCRGDMTKCKETECHQHESWYAREIVLENRKLNAEVEQLRELFKAIPLKCPSCLEQLKDDAVRRRDFTAAAEYRDLLERSKRCDRREE
jgi:hypothetical protein